MARGKSVSRHFYKYGVVKVYINFKMILLLKRKKLMIKVKRIFISLSLICMVVTASVSAMEKNPGQLTMAQLVVYTCGQSIWNTLSGVKNVAHYGVSVVAPEVRCLPEVINGALIDMTEHDEEQNELKLSTESLKNNDNNVGANAYHVLSALQNGVYYGANCARTMINDVLTHAVLGEEEL